MKKFLYLIAICVFYGCQVNSDSENYINIIGGKIHYTVYGKGEPLIIINGGPGYSSEHMIPFANEFSKNYKVILFDTRGTGKSQIKKYDSTTINMDLLVKDIDTLIDVLGYQSVNIMGHSFGGITAMYFAHKHPERIKKMILSSSAGIDLEFISVMTENISKRTKQQMDSTAKVPVTVEERTEFFFERVRTNAEAYLYDKSKVEELKNELTKKGSYHPDVNQLLWIDLFEMKYDLKLAFKNYQSPVLIIQGDYDFLGNETAEKIHKAFPGSNLKFIKNCGHVPWMDQNEIFQSELKQFLSE